MNLRSHMILLFALVAGVAGAMGMRTLFYRPAIPVDVSVETRDLPQVPVMVAKTDLNVGDELTPQNIRFLRFPEEKIPRDAIVAFRDVVGRRVTKPVRQKELISLYDLNNPDLDEEKTPVFIPPGFQPVPIQIDAITHASKELASQIVQFLSPQDVVTISALVEEDEPTENSDRKHRQRKLANQPLIDEVVVYRVVRQQRPADNSGVLEKFTLVYLLLNESQQRILEEAAHRGTLLLTRKTPTAGGTEKAESLMGVGPMPILSSPTLPVLAPVSTQSPLESAPVPSVEPPVSSESRSNTDSGTKISPFDTSETTTDTAGIEPSSPLTELTESELTEEKSGETPENVTEESVSGATLPKTTPVLFPLVRIPTPSNTPFHRTDSNEPLLRNAMISVSPSESPSQPKTEKPPSAPDNPPSAGNPSSPTDNQSSTPDNSPDNRSSATEHRGVFRPRVTPTG